MDSEQETWLVTLAKAAHAKLIGAETLLEFSEIERVGLELTEENLDKLRKEYLTHEERGDWVYLHIG